MKPRPARIGASSASAILYSIKPHLTAQAILQEAVRKMDAMLATMTFSKPLYEKAAKEFVDGYRRRAQADCGRRIAAEIREDPST